MHKPVVFLDIDGVLNSKQWYAHERCLSGRHFTVFNRAETLEYSIDPDCVQRLNRILQQTGAVVIVSSSWRKKHALSEIVSILESRGFRGEVDGATSANGTLSRTEEITEWLAENRPPGAAYVVIDDELTSALPTERVVSPSNQTGLTDRDVEQAIAILTGTF
jgi:Swiss Army Knife RNA repair-like protein